MSGFDLQEQETLERLSTFAPVRVPETGLFDGFARGVGMTTMRNLARTGSAIDLLGSIGPIATDAITGGTVAQDRYFREHDDVWGSAVDQWTLKPGEVGAAGQVVGELASMLPMVLASPGLTLGSLQLSTAEELSREGISPGKAQAAGAAQAAGLGLGIWMPILGQNLWQRVALGGAGFNVLQGIGMRGATEMILEGTPAAERFKAMDLQAITLDALLGAAFGGFVHLSPASRAQGAEMWKRIEGWATELPASQKAAIAALRVAQHLNVDSAAGVPASAADVEAHVQRARTAIEQVVRDQPVQVSDLAEPKFEPDKARQAEAAARVKALNTEAAAVRAIEGIPEPAPRLQIDFNPGLPPEMQMVERRFANQIQGNVDAALQAYKALPATEGGKILNTDLARELSPDYAASLDSRSRYAAAVHEPASAVVKELYERALEQPPGPGELNMVTFTAGGTGAGKTGAITRTPLASEVAQASQIVYDTNLNSVRSAAEKIDMALDKGKRVNILWVGRDPIESLKGALSRAMKIGRTVPIEEHAKTHIGSAATVEALMQRYQGNDNVGFIFLDNSGAKGEVTIAGPELARSYNLENLPERLKETLDAEYQAGRVSEAIYHGFAGHVAQGGDAVSGRGGAGEPAGEHAQAPGRRTGPLPREEVGPAKPPAPGEKFLVYRLGSTEALANRNAGNADSVARFIMGTEDPMGPVASRAGKVFAYEVELEQPFGKYEGLTGARAGKEPAVGRVTRGDEVAYSFPEAGYKMKPIGARSLEDVRAILMKSGHSSFDDAGAKIGARAIRAAFTEPEAPAANRSGAEPPPPPGSRRSGDVAGAEGLDTVAQSEWLAQKASEAGFASVDDMVGKDIGQFLKLTDEWRMDHPAEAGGKGDPLKAEADRIVAERPDAQIRVGTNPDGTPINRGAKDFLDEARANANRAREDASLFEVAAGCLLGGG